MPFGSAHNEKHEKPSDRFLKVSGVKEPDREPLKTAFTIGVAEWARRHRDSEHNRWSFFATQLIAPIAAATATVLAATGISMWAVIPAAIATVASSILASFGLRENSVRLRHMTRELGFEIVKFAEGYGSYRHDKDDARVDRLMKRIDELSIQSVFDPGKAPPPPPATHPQPPTTSPGKAADEN